MGSVQHPVRRQLDELDASDVEERLERREKDARRHTLWALLGVSPSALIPLVAAGSELGVWAVIVGMLVVVTKESLAAFRAHGEASDLREELHRLRSEWSSSSPDGEEVV